MDKANVAEADPVLDQIQKVLDARAAGQPVEEDPRVEAAPVEAAPENENTTEHPAEADSVAVDESGSDAGDDDTDDATAAVEDVDETPASDGDLGDGNYERALSALRRAKVPKSVIDSLPKAEALRWGSETAEILAQKDRLFRENLELKKQATDPKPAQSTSDEELPDEVQALVTPIVEFAGKETADAVLGVAKAMHAKSRKDQALVGSALQSMLANSARRSLEERFPQLKNADRFKLVRAKAEKLIATGDYQNDDIEEGYRNAFSDASKILFSDEIEAAARTQQRNGRKSQTTTAPSKVPTPRVLTDDQKLTATILDLAEKKLTPEQARAKYGWT